MDLTSYTLVILRRPPTAPDMTSDELAALQEQHLDHLSKMRDEGHLLIFGPVADQPDESLRGLCVYGVGLDEARLLAEQDPSVQAGRLTVDVMTWWMATGSWAHAAATEARLGSSTSSAAKRT